VKESECFRVKTNWNKNRNRKAKET